MSYNKKALEQQRKLVEADHAYDPRYFQRKHGITIQQSRDIIRRVGNDRLTANQLACELKQK